MTGMCRIIRGQKVVIFWLQFWLTGWLKNIYNFQTVSHFLNLKYVSHSMLHRQYDLKKKLNFIKFWPSYGGQKYEFLIFLKSCSKKIIINYLFKNIPKNMCHIQRWVFYIYLKSYKKYFDLIVIRVVRQTPASIFFLKF